MDQVELYWQEEQPLSFTPRGNIDRLAIRALSSIIWFCGDETTKSQCDCPICIEKLKNRVIQPFGICSHEFQLSYLNSSLLNRKTTSSICHKEYSISMY